MNGALWSSAESLGRVVLLCVLAYGALVVMLRIGGKRTTSKLNAYDWVVTVALGSMLGATVLTDAVPLLEGVAAFATLIALQWILSWLATRSKLVHQIVKSEPALLYWQGEFLRERMRAERVAEDESRPWSWRPTPSSASCGGCRATPGEHRSTLWRSRS